LTVTSENSYSMAQSEVHDWHTCFYSW